MEVKSQIKNYKFQINLKYKAINVLNFKFRIYSLFVICNLIFRI